MKNLMSLFCGILFGAGLSISQMVNPNKVLMFLDMFGDWDPSLAFVIVGGTSVFSLGYFLIVKKRHRPIFGEDFALPTNIDIDKNLIIGAIIFGLGWGLTGICPGPAIANMSGGNVKIYGFIVMMLVGMQLVSFISNKRELH